MKTNRIFAAVIAATAIMCTGCDAISGGSPASSAATNQEPTAAEKKAYVQEKYPQYFKNDLRGVLPFNDIMGLPLAELRTAVDASPNWAVETSSAAIHIGLDNIAYSFSNRAFHLQDSDADSPLDYVLGGLVNKLSVAWNEADYVDVFTDSSAKQLVTDIYILKKNTELTFDDIKNELSGKYTLDEDSTDDTIHIAGIISEPDYAAIYDYDHGLTTTKPARSGLGFLSFKMSKDKKVAIFRCYEGLKWE